MPGRSAFPAGASTPTDADAVAAALREAEEEVGLPRASVEMIGRLDTYVTRTGFEVTPCVGFVMPPELYRPDPFEVAEVFEVPLHFFLRQAEPPAGKPRLPGQGALLLRLSLERLLHLGRHRGHAQQSGRSAGRIWHEA